MSFSLKKKENSDIITWRNYEDIVLSRINQSQKDKYYIVMVPTRA